MNAESGTNMQAKWGETISEERQAELELILQRWEDVIDYGTRLGPFDGLTLNGADVFYLATRALAGPDGDMDAAAALLLAANRWAAIPELSGLHLEGSHLAGAILDGAILASAHLKGADLSGAHLVGALLDEVQLMEANLAGALLNQVILSPDDDYVSLDAPRSSRGIGGMSGADAGSDDANGTLPSNLGDSNAEETSKSSEGRESGERVIFTGYYPREVATQIWERLLIFLAPDTVEAAAEVAAAAAERLQIRQHEFRDVSAPSQTTVNRGSRLTLVPSLPGFRVDPAGVTAEWKGETRCYEFQLRAEQAQPDRAINGVVQIFEGPLLRGEIPVAIFVRARGHTVPGNIPTADVRAYPYRNTFPSYSRQDEPLVRAFESVVEASGDRFLRDVRMLRSGEQWAPRLLELIDQADVFQLFWSQAAAESLQVEREWRYALTLESTRPTFIRPVYWTPKPYKLATELKPFNFGRIDPKLLGFQSPTLMERLFGYSG